MGRMLISRETGRFAEIDASKVRSGRFLTTSNGWLATPVRDFLTATGASTVVDPFAGDGHLFEHLRDAGFEFDSIGYDIAPGWSHNDSLVSIPSHPDAVIVTNPPYLAKHSAARKRVLDEIAHYLDADGDYDLYQVALRRCLASASHVVALLPETYLHAGVLRERLERVVVIEQAETFSDTTCPIVVACFGPRAVSHDRTEVYLDDRRLGSLAELDAIRRAPAGARAIRFNDPDGNIALQAVDGVDPATRIAFMPRTDSNYGVEGIKVSSRLVTFLTVDGVDHPDEVLALVDRANRRIERLRDGIGELSLSPFKGNNRAGRRRRRLDYRQARWILTDALAASR